MVNNNKEKPWYLCGPMTGYAQFNFPLFHKAAEQLRYLGYTIISPAEEDTPEVKKEALASSDGSLKNGKIGGLTWGEILAKDVILVADKVQGIIFLPKWWQSKGAVLEATVGLLQGPSFKFKQYNNKITDRISHEEVLNLVQYGLSERIGISRSSAA